MDLDGKIFEVKVFIDIAIYANDATFCSKCDHAAD